MPRGGTPGKAALGGGCGAMLGRAGAGGNGVAPGTTEPANTMPLGDGAGDAVPIFPCPAQVTATTALTATSSTTPARSGSKERIFNLCLFTPHALLLHTPSDVTHQPVDVGLERRATDAGAAQGLLGIAGVIAHEGGDLVEERARTLGHGVQARRAQQRTRD